MADLKNLPVDVDFTIAESGRVSVRRIKQDGRWLPVEQGRQWQDEDGRHVLVMHSDGKVNELLLDGRLLQWAIVPRRHGPMIV